MWRDDEVWRYVELNDFSKILFILGITLTITTELIPSTH